jgi:hypothetical protein
MSSFVKKTIKKSHGTLVETLASKASNMSKADVSQYLTRQTTFGDHGDAYTDNSSHRSSSVPPSQGGMSHLSKTSSPMSTASAQQDPQQQYQRPYQGLAPAPAPAPAELQSHSESPYPAPLRPRSADRRDGDLGREHWNSQAPAAMPQQTRERWSGFNEQQQQQQQQQPSWTANDQRRALPSQVSVQRTNSGGARLVYDPYAPKSTGGPGNDHFAELA